MAAEPQPETLGYRIPRVPRLSSAAADFAAFET